MPDALAVASSLGRSNLSLPLSSERRESISRPLPSRRRIADQPLTLDHCLDELRGRVVQALASLGYPPLVAVGCETAGDRIVLSGSVPSYHLKQMAQVAALRVAGPGRVDNRVVVTSQ